MKVKIFSFFLCFILVFNLFSYSVHAEGISSSLSDSITTFANDSSMAIEEFASKAYSLSVELCGSGFATCISVYDSTAGVIGAGMRRFRDLIRSGLTPQQAYNAMNQSIVVGDGTRSLTGDGLTYVENYYSSGSMNGTGTDLSDLGYVNYYYPNVNFLLPADFAYNSNYLAVKNLMNNNPDYWFRICYINTGGYYWYYVFCTNQAPLGAVCSSSYWGGEKITSDFYNSNWTQDFSIDESGQNALICFSVKRNDDLYMEYINDEGEPVEIEDPLSTIDIDNYLVPTSEIKQYNPQLFGNFNSPVVLYSNEQSMIEDYRNETGFMSYSQQSRAGSVFHGSWGSGINQIEVFPTLNSLKNGTLGIQGINSNRLLPTFGTNGVNDSEFSDSTLQQAESIINNYYSSSSSNNPGGGGSSSDPGGGGSSDDDSGSDSLWKVLASAVKNLISFIVDVLGSAINSLIELLDKLVGFFDNARQLVGSGFSDFVAAFFPYLPEEWITLVSLSIGLVLFFWVLKKFL